MQSKCFYYNYFAIFNSSTNYKHDVSDLLVSFLITKYKPLKLAVEISTVQDGSSNNYKKYAFKGIIYTGPPLPASQVYYAG